MVNSPPSPGEEEEGTVELPGKDGHGLTLGKEGLQENTDKPPVTAEEIDFEAPKGSEEVQDKVSKRMKGLVSPPEREGDKDRVEGCDS